MNFSGLSQESFLGELLRLPLRILPGGLRLPILQGGFRGKWWIVAAGHYGCWLGSYEYEKRRLFEAEVNRGHTVYDLGAHAGYYTLLASVLVGPEGKVFAFEPLPQNLFYLKEHMRINRLKNVTVIEAAVSDHNGRVRFGEGPDRYTGKIAPDGSIVVQAVSLDSYVSEHGLPAPDLIKMDVEGAELAALTGAKSLLARHHPKIFLAVHGEDLRRQCRDFLASLGYRLRGLDRENLEQAWEILAWP
jgi:FkbM family methyltransferase